MKGKDIIIVISVTIELSIILFFTGGLKMSIYEALTILTFIITSIMMIIHILESATLTLANLLSLANTFPCYSIEIYRNGRKLKHEAWLNYLNNCVDYYELKDGILYIRIL